MTMGINLCLIFIQNWTSNCRVIYFKKNYRKEPFWLDQFYFYRFRKEIAIVKGYQKKCNAFFMDMVSQLCFAENSPPSVEVIKKLLSFITFDGPKESGHIQTKVMSIFDTGIDPTPVFRSFLLQLLLKSR